MERVLHLLCEFTLVLFSIYYLAMIPTTIAAIHRIPSPKAKTQT